MSPYKLRYRVYSCFAGNEIEVFLDNYDDIYEFINTNIHSGFIRVEAAIVGPPSIIPVFAADEGDTVLCKTKILETHK